MCIYKIEGGHRLNGQIEASCAKNSVLPMIFASILTNEQVTLQNISPLSDVKASLEILQLLGGKYDMDEEQLHICNGSICNSQAPYEAVRKMRASILAMGPLLAKMGKVNIALPGGCAIGSRPVDLHIKGLTALGASISLEHGTLNAHTKQLKGAQIYLDFPSVGATENIMMAAVLAKGETIIRNAAAEPEVEDLANFLGAMGARICGQGTDTIIIEGVSSLNGVSFKPITDRIEVGTFLVATTACGGDVTINNINPEHIRATIAKLTESGAKITEMKNGVRIKADGKPCKFDIKSLPYPGFPTDMQAQLCALASIAGGTSMVVETVFEQRYNHIAELVRMGADIKVDERTAIITGVSSLSGTSVCAPDLRGGAALVIAGLCAKGTTEISDEGHLKRGYYHIEDKLQNLGAKITCINV